MVGQGPSWDVVADIQLLLQFHFMQNAFLAGTLVALLAGATGYFVVLRGQSFVAHMLSQVGFPGAAAGVLLHVSPVLGLITFCVAAAVGIGWLGRDVEAGNRAESAAVGSILAFSLGLGLLFFRLYAGSAQGIYAFLFGSILGIADRDVLLTFAMAAAGLAVLVWMGRPLVFASVDPDVAAARGASASVAPGASALQLTARPGLGFVLSIVLALAFTWVGLALAYFSDFPVGFFVTSLAFGAYVVIRAPKTLPVRTRAVYA